MIESLKPYADYAGSSHPWLGKVPAHWELTTVGAVTGRRSARNRTDLPLLSVLREKGVVLRSSLGEDENHNVVPEDLSNYRVALTSDLVINKMKAWQGSVGVAPCDGIVSPAYFVFELLKIAQPFAHRLFRSRPYVAFFAQSSDGVRVGQWDLSIDRMKRIPVPIPPAEEQTAIVRFLAAMDRKVNRLVRAKRRLIELLTEQKQAIITHVVTRSLNPNVKLKPSGIDWLGDIPEHWEVRRAKYLYHEIDERSITGEEELLSVSHITGVTPRSEKNITMFKAASYVGQKLCQPGDLVINTMWAWMAALGSSTRTGIVSNAYNVYRPSKPNVINGAYVEAMLHAPHYKAEILFRSTGIRASRLRLYPEKFLEMPLLLPPFSEQAAICSWSQQATSALHNAIGRVESEISLIREYRIRLVADVVTGKLDIRAAAAHLSEEEDAPAPAEADIDVEDAEDEADLSETDEEVEA